MVRKDLTKLIKEGANVPVYVLEYLLGMYCASNDEEIIPRRYGDGRRPSWPRTAVRPDEAEKVKSKIKGAQQLQGHRQGYGAGSTSAGISTRRCCRTWRQKMLRSPQRRQQFEKLLGWRNLVHRHGALLLRKRAERIALHHQRPKTDPAAQHGSGGSVRGRKAFSEAQWIDVALPSTGMEPSNLDERVKWHLMGA